MPMSFEIDYPNITAYCDIDMWSYCKFDTPDRAPLFIGVIDYDHIVPYARIESCDDAGIYEAMHRANMLKDNSSYMAMGNALLTHAIQSYGAANYHRGFEDGRRVHEP